MEGDEPRARQLLLAMQEHLARDPYDALGVTPSSPPGDVRNAFLALTKTYHPARFARMAVDVQKLANEVFLALRGAHDQLSRPAANAPARRSGPIPTAMPRASTPPQTAGAPVHPASSAQTTPYGTRPTGQQPPLARPGQSRTSASGAVPVTPASTSNTRPLPTGQQPPLARSTPTGQQPPLARPTPTGRTPTPQQPRAPGARFVAPDSAITRPMGSGQAPGATPPATAPRRPTSPGMPAVARTTTARQAHDSRAPASASTPPAPQDRELAAILELMVQGHFAPARLALETLAARAPDVPRYRALIAYSKGREAQLARRIDEARVELQEALQIDPELVLAKTALAELFTRRK